MHNMTALDTEGGFIRVSGTEQRVCQDIGARQAMGIAKYGTTVEQNPLSRREWAQHAYEEALDLAIYLKRLIEVMDKEADDGR